MAGGAGAETLELTSAGGNSFSAALAEAAEPSGGPAVVIFPDVRGLYRFYIELAERFADAGHHAIALDYYGRTAGLAPRGDDFDYTPHRERVKLEQATEDIQAAIAALGVHTEASELATVGFCFGGSLSFVSATNPDLGLARAVGLYGVLDASRFNDRGPLAQARETRIPVLGLFGGADQAI